MAGISTPVYDSVPGERDDSSFPSEQQQKMSYIPAPACIVAPNILLDPRAVKKVDCNSPPKQQQRIPLIPAPVYSFAPSVWQNPRPVRREYSNFPSGQQQRMAYVPPPMYALTPYIIPNSRSVKREVTYQPHGGIDKSDLFPAQVSKMAGISPVVYPNPKDVQKGVCSLRPEQQLRTAYIPLPMYTITPYVCPNPRPVRREHSELLPAKTEDTSSPSEDQRRLLGVCYGSRLSANLQEVYLIWEFMHHDLATYLAKHPSRVLPVYEIRKENENLWYKSPDYFLCDNRKYSVDVWSAGCIIAELFMKEPLFKGIDVADQLDKIFNIVGTPDWLSHPEYDISFFVFFPKKLPQPINRFVSGSTTSAANLLSDMLKVHMQERITVKDALGMAFFNE